MFEHELGVVGEEQARVGQRDGSHGAIEQGEPHLLLERGDLLRDRRLRVAELIGGARERAMLRDVAQRSQPSNVVQHQQSLSKHEQVKLH